jgi:uncharacterized damage-inducible protein DinB
MTSYLHELYAHQEWADAEHWRAFEAHSTALEDKAIRERLLHIHLVQHAFLWITGTRSEAFRNRKLEEFATTSDLKNYARQGLTDLNALVHSLDGRSAEQVIDVIWFRPPAKISIRQALTQAAMHSHYHRAQNATRMRELGGTPPTTDFIIWLHQGMPVPQWE